jgi:hypothetical protein
MDENPKASGCGVSKMRVSVQIPTFFITPQFFVHEEVNIGRPGLQTNG